MNEVTPSCVIIFCLPGVGLAYVALTWVVGTLGQMATATIKDLDMVREGKIKLAALLWTADQSTGKISMYYIYRLQLTFIDSGNEEYIVIISYNPPCKPRRWLYIYITCNYRVLEYILVM